MLNDVVVAVDQIDIRNQTFEFVVGKMTSSNPKVQIRFMRTQPTFQVNMPQPKLRFDKWQTNPPGRKRRKVRPHPTPVMLLLLFLLGSNLIIVQSVLWGGGRGTNERVLS